MINAILISNNSEDTLIHTILELCPQIHIIKRVHSFHCAREAILYQQAKLLFLEINTPVNTFNFELLQDIAALELESIIVTSSRNLPIQVMECDACGYIVKPVQKIDLSLAVNHAMKCIHLKEECKKKQRLIDTISTTVSHEKLFGIPTIEGFIFFALGDIIRCEALQKCTRLVTQSRSNFVSSYNLGEFRKLLEPFGFFSPHRSHLINPTHVSEYLREGTIIMSDNSYVPIAKHKKKVFLDSITHL